MHYSTWRYSIGALPPAIRPDAVVRRAAQHVAVSGGDLPHGSVTLGGPRPGDRRQPAAGPHHHAGRDVRDGDRAVSGGDLRLGREAQLIHPRPPQVGATDALRLLGRVPVDDGAVDEPQLQLVAPVLGEFAHLEGFEEPGVPFDACFAHVPEAGREDRPFGMGVCHRLLGEPVGALPGFAGATAGEEQVDQPAGVGAAAAAPVAVFVRQVVLRVIRGELLRPGAVPPEPWDVAGQGLLQPLQQLLLLRYWPAAP
jgi:hypothetical protein